MRGWWRWWESAARARAAAIGLTIVAALAVTDAWAHDVSTPDPYAILARVKAGLRARERPAYVIYTLVRRDRLDGMTDFLNSYTLRIWCRTSDSAALSRRVLGRERGPAQFIVPAFDQPIDPGPPTADLLDVIRAAQSTRTPAPHDPSAPAVIGSVSTVIETTYRVTYAGVAGDDDHLRLEARRDPDRNRLTDLYVDRSTGELHRAVARDHLYMEGRTIPIRFEIDFALQAGIPVISAIHGQTDYAELDRRAGEEPLHETDYRFEDIAFPADLPAWYFEPRTYGEHRAEFPT